VKGLHQKIQQRWPGEVIDLHDQHGDETVLLRPGRWPEIAACLKTDPDFELNILMDLTAVDGLDLGWPERFQVVYHFYSMPKNHRLRVKIPVSGERPHAPTLTGLWPIANWFEREVWDMFGIRFDGHPDLRRILLYEEFSGHPLRKDYPLNKRQPLIGSKG
jgi:NADH-quinone oxidoreductase subunit C